MNIHWTDIGAVSTAGLGAAATWGAWMAARKSSSTADAVARIERDRWHAELTPQFDITIERGEGERATLNVRLAGPVPLRHLDQIAIRIVSSDDMDRTPRTPAPPTLEDIEAQVWGPYQFTHGADGADENGQTVDPFRLHVGRGRPFSLERTRPPRWQQGDDRDTRWRDQWLNLPMRLVLTCSRDGFKDWVVPCDVDVPQSPRMRWVN